MSILSDLLGQFGGLSGIAKQGQSGALQQIGQLAGGTGVGQMAGMGGPLIGQLAAMGGPIASQIDPAVQSGGAIGQAANPEQPNWFARNAENFDKLGAWGAGVSKASGPSATPVDFGQALAGGQDSLDKYKTGQLDNRLKEAQIGKAGQGDLKQMAETALTKSKMGVPLTPQEEGALQAYDTINQSKLSYTQDKFGNFMPQPAARSILPPGMSGQMANQPGGPQAQGTPEGQSPRQGFDPSQMRGYFQYLQQKAGQ